MFCPNCKYEYVEGVTVCPDCEVELVEVLPTIEYEYVEMVTVLIPEDMPHLLIAKSILEDAEIRYFAKNEHIQNLFALGQLGFGFNPLVGPIELQVAKEDVETALELLSHIPEGVEIEEQYDGEYDEEYDDEDFLI